MSNLNSIPDATTIEARYQRAQYLRSGILNNKLHFNDAVFPIWIENSDCFWYERTIKSTKVGDGHGKEYRLVDAKAATNELAFDHTVFAAAMAEAAQQTVDPTHLPISKVKITLDPLTVSFDAFEKCWRFNGATGACNETTLIKRTRLASPNGRQALFVRKFNLWVQDLDSGEERALTQDGNADYAYASTSIAWGDQIDPSPFPQARWSADGEWVFTVQRDNRLVKTLPIVHHIPEDGSLRPQVKEAKVAYPGDDHVETYRLLTIHAKTGRVQEANYRQTPTVCNGHGFFKEGMGWWGADSRHAYFVDMERDYKTVRVVELNPDTGATRIVLEETSETFLNLSQNNDEHPTFMPLPESNEVLWWSERSGWAHLYLYDLKTGKLKNSVTEGDWVVRDTCSFDAVRREVFLQTGGRHPDRDLYYRDLVRVNIDSGELTTLIDGDHDIFVASHKNTVTDLSASVYGWDIKDANGIAPSGDYAVVTRTRADEVSVSILLDRTGKAILELETTDISRLPDDWQWPEPVKTLAADGKTDIYGLMFKPSDFSPDQSYPVVSHVFNVPDAPFVAKGSFEHSLFLNWCYLDAAALAELGFIVVQVDGRGTPWRSKAFQDESYGSYQAASNLDDHVAGIKQLAESYPCMDVSRVGIYSCIGTDGVVMGMLKYPNFYKVGVNGDCLHDTRLESAQLVGDMYEGVSGSMSQPLEEQVGSLKGKLLLIHGMLNNMAPPAATFRLIDALMAANKDFDMLLPPKMGHDLIPDYLMRRAWDYLVEHLMGAEPPKQFHLQCGEAWSGFDIEED